MAYVMLLNLRIILFFVYLIVERFKKMFIHLLAMGSMIVYCTNIILNILSKVANYIELRVVKSWSTYLEVD